jgi:hypothetical protein
MTALSGGLYVQASRPSTRDLPPRGGGSRRYVQFQAVEEVDEGPTESSTSIIEQPSALVLRVLRRVRIARGPDRVLATNPAVAALSHSLAAANIFRISPAR